MSANQQPKSKRGRPLSKELFVMPSEFVVKLNEIGFFDAKTTRYTVWPSLPNMDKYDRIYRFRAAVQRAILVNGKEVVEIATRRSWKQMSRYLAGDDAPISVIEAVAVAADLPATWILSGTAEVAHVFIETIAQDDAKNRNSEIASDFARRAARDPAGQTLDFTLTNEDGDDLRGEEADFRVRDEETEEEPDYLTGRGALASRIREAMGDLSQRDFSIRIGVGQATLSQYLAARTEPTWSTLVRIAEASNRSLIWLMTGEDTETKAAPEPTNAIYVPRFDCHASAGHGEKVFDEPPSDILPVPREMLRNFTGNTKYLVATDVRGDSMEPTLHEGDLIIFDRSARLVDREAVYVLTVGEDLFVKRLRRIPTQDGTSLSLISDNPAYPEVRLDPDTQERVRVHGRVIWPNTSRRL